MRLITIVTSCLAPNCEVTETSEGVGLGCRVHDARNEEADAVAHQNRSNGVDFRLFHDRVEERREQRTMLTSQAFAPLGVHVRGALVVLFNAEIRKANVRTDVIRPRPLCFRSACRPPYLSISAGPDEGVHGKAQQGDDQPQLPSRP